MRLATWIVLLSVLNFGIGWVSATIAEGESEADAPRADRDRDRGSRHNWGGPKKSGGFPGGWGGRNNGNPFEQEFRSFTDELGLADEDRQVFEQVFDGIEAEVDALQKQIFEVLGSSEERIDAVLTDAQRGRLKELRVARGEDFCRQRREGVQSFLSESGLSEEQVTQVVSIYAENDAKKLDLIRDRVPGTEGRRGCDARMKEFSEQRDERLEKVLGDEWMDRLEDYRRRGWGSHRGGRDGRGGSPGDRGGRRGGPRADDDDRDEPGDRGERGGRGGRGPERRDRDGDRAKPDDGEERPWPPRRLPN